MSRERPRAQLTHSGANTFISDGSGSTKIRFYPAKVVQTAVTEHGTKFNQVIEIVGANGKRIEVTFAWIRNNDGVVRFVTSIPAKKSS